MLELNAYITFFDAVLGRVSIAAGQPEQARHRLDTGLELAEDTGMRFYDAELLRLRAQTTPTPTPAKPTSPPPLILPAAKGRRCSNCALHSTITTCAASPPAPPSPTCSDECPSMVRGQNWTGRSPFVSLHAPST